MGKIDCIFCREKNRKTNKIFESKLFFAKWDPNPVTKGHALIIPKRHIQDYFEMRDKEAKELFSQILKLKNIVDKKYKPVGYNIGINCGKAAGQTVFHLHIHFIPRYTGDVKKPRGGVRHIIPGKGYY
jgi:diadenosine tetraphosphate (Ap4A) HIT family hydrolase